MNILLIDKGGYFTNFALQCLAARHEVKWALKALPGGQPNPQGDGMGVPKVRDWEPHMKWADLILVPDNAVYMESLGVWRRKGFPIWGPNEEISQWEMRREEGLRVLGKFGIPLIPSHSFTRLSDGVEFLHKNPKRYVFKLDDDNDSKAMSYVSKSARDLLFMMEKWQKAGRVKGGFILQEFVEGVEVAVGGWFGSAGFAPVWCENWEHKKLMNGEIGPNTGEMGTVLRYVKESRLGEHFLRPLEGDLYRAGYTGYIDVAAIAAKDGEVYPLEFTTRPGWPLFEIQQSLHPEPVEWIARAMQGDWKGFSPREEIATGVCVCIPDFPYGKAPLTELCGFPLFGWEKIPRKQIYLSQVKMGNVPKVGGGYASEVVTAGVNVCTVTGLGATVKESSENAYQMVKKLELPNSPLYRTDIGDKLREAIPELKRLGWVEEIRYG